MSSIDYENHLLNAIETIVDNAVDKAGYDKTIKAIIDKCVDATSGCYQLKYQNSVFEAFAADKDIIYSKGVLVQVLIPGNDMTQNKTILGLVQGDQAESIVSPSLESQYNITGANAIQTTNSFSLCSYTANDIEMLYNKEASIDLLNLDINTLEKTIKESNAIKCGAEFKTNLPSEQAIRGNYGIAFDIDFKDNITGNIITKTYIIDINQMIGNPYSFKDYTSQYNFFDINGENFDSIKQIYIFAENFPHTATGKDDDIFIQNIELSCAKKMTEEELMGYSLTLITSGRNYFNTEDTNDDSIIVLANFKVKGNSVNETTPGVEYYWFRENNSINKRSLNYSNYGGEGWECLNNYNVVNEGADTKTWVPGSSSCIVKKSDIPAGIAKYKCVVVYNVATVVEESIEIYNYDTLYNLEIISDQGTTFYYDNGNPTLTLTVNGSGVLDSNLTCKWGVVDNNNKYIELPETTTENNEYNTTKAAYDTLLANIASGAAMPAANRETLETYKATLDNYNNIRRVEGNVIYKAQIRDVTDYSIYKCSVYDNDIYIGTASITLTNNLNIEGIYHLEIINGEQVFNYNAMGVSPASEAFEDPIQIQPLSFRIYDNLGNELGDIIYHHCDVQWTIPKTNTMLVGSDATNVLSYSFGIDDIYDNFKTNNNIELTVKYKELNLKGETTFSFLKDGDPGTNGTDIVCKIVPNISGNLNTYPMLINGIPNFTPAAAGKWFKVQLWKNGKLIFNNVSNGNSTEGIAATVKWSVLKNKYTNSVSDTSAITIDNNGNFSYNNFGNNYANIVKCQVVYDGKYYYSMLPLITQNITDNDYTIELEKNTGYRYVMYSSGGKEPQYDNTYPFTLKVMKMINGFSEDVSNTPNSTYKLTYNWAAKGRVYKSTGWVNTNNLTVVSGETTNINKRNFKPSDTFDGECVTNAVYITISNNGTQVAEVHIPVHFYLNKYGIAALNNWDGNSIDINNELGSILAPQVGAGSKNNSNQFTGVLMGKVKESNLTEKEGLFGFYKGEQTIFLDAHTGKAEFGKQGASQIILDPTDGTAKIQSGNYVPGTSGMLIDFTTPLIKFGSGNFEVNSSGHITAKGGGTIAGWNISDTKLSKGKVGISSNNSSDNNYAFWAGNSTASSAPFSVTFGGALKATSADIEGKINASSGKIGNWNITSGAITNGNVQLTSDGNLIASGVNISGGITATTLTATQGGSIGPWIFNNEAIYNSKGIGVDGSCGLGNIDGWAFWAGNGAFRVQQNGTVHCSKLNATGGKIGNWNISNGAIKYNDNIYLGSSGAVHFGNSNYYFEMGTGTHHPKVSSLNVGDASGSGASVVINGGAINYSNSTFNLQGNVQANGEFRVKDGGTIYNGTGFGKWQNFCISLTVSNRQVTQSKWVGLYFVNGLLVNIGSVQTFDY